HPLTSGYTSADFPEFYESDGTTPIEVPYESFAGKNQRGFFRTGYVYENSISINSGHEKGSCTVRGGRTQNEGVVPGNAVTRTTINVGGIAKLYNGFYTSGSLNYVKTDQETPPIGG